MKIAQHSLTKVSLEIWRSYEETYRTVPPVPAFLSTFWIPVWIPWRRALALQERQDNTTADSATTFPKLRKGGSHEAPPWKAAENDGFQ